MSLEAPGPVEVRFREGKIGGWDILFPDPTQGTLLTTATSNSAFSTKDSQPLKFHVIIGLVKPSPRHKQGPHV